MLRVLELGQRLRLGPLDGRDLQDHRPAGQVGLLGEVDAGERARCPAPACRRKPKTSSPTSGSRSVGPWLDPDPVVPGCGRRCAARPSRPGTGTGRGSAPRIRSGWALRRVAASGRSRRPAGSRRPGRSPGRSASDPGGPPPRWDAPRPRPPSARRGWRLRLRSQRSSGRPRPRLRPRRRPGGPSAQTKRGDALVVLAIEFRSPGEVPRIDAPFAVRRLADRGHGQRPRCSDLFRPPRRSSTGASVGCGPPWGSRARVEGRHHLRRCQWSGRNGST